MRRVAIERTTSAGAWATDGTRRLRLRGRLSELASDEQYDLVVNPGLSGGEVLLTVCDAREAQQET